ncbi:MAG: ATP-binding cassette domain-containing protein [Steroidobacteraceae bacterium]
MISFRNLSLRRGTRILFAQATFSLFRAEKIGIVGANGTGKSSLLALIRGELTPDAGEFELPRNLVLASVAQEIDADARPALEFVLDGDAQLRDLQRRLAGAEALDDGEQIAHLHADLEAIGGYTAAARAAQLLAGLGFAPGDERRAVAEFSGGWRVRLALAQALMCRSDVLLLDEPTNHLDLDAVVWLEDWLRLYPGTLLVISHDREFLDHVVARIVSIDGDAISVYTGNYSDFEIQRAARLAERAAAFVRQQREIAHVQDFVRRFRAAASKARQAQSRIKWLERLERIAPAHVDSPFQFAFLEPSRLPRPLLSIDRGIAGYESSVILRDLGISILPGDRIALLGRNGAGKSTMMRTLAGVTPLLEGNRMAAADLNIGYFAQHQLEQLEGGETPLWHLKRHGGSALAMATEAEQRSFLGLDEPTNHLDLEMRHALAMALQDFTGAIVLVSHDRYLLRGVADLLWLVADGKAEPFEGDLDDYERWLRSAAPGRSSPQAVAERSTARSNEGRDAGRVRKRLEAEERARVAPLRAELQRREHQISQLGTRSAALEARLSDPELYATADHSVLTQLLAEQADVRRQLSEAEEAWLTAGEALERAASN